MGRWRWSVVIWLGVAGAASAGPDAWLDDRIAMGRFDGVVVVRQADGTVWSRAHGQAAPGTPNGRDVAYPLGSIAKPVTALAALALVEDGQLDPEATVGTLLPGFSDRPAAAVTVRQLLVHASGVPGIVQRGQGLDEAAQLADLGAPIERAALLEQFADAPLRFPAGSRYAYSNSNYVLLAEIVERIGGRPFAEWVDARVFAPAGMDACVVCSAPQGLAAASPHERDADGLRPVAPPHPERLFGAGALWATPDALLALAGAVAAGDLLDPATARFMRESDLATGRGSERAAAGWMLQEVGGRTWLTHGGALPGLVAGLAVEPETGAAVVAIRNATLPLDHLDHEQASMDALLRALMAHAVDASPSPQPVLARDASERWAGAWRLADGREFALAPDDAGSLVLRTSGAWSPHDALQESPMTDEDAGTQVEAVLALVDDWRHGAAGLWGAMDDTLRAALDPERLAGMFAGLEAEHGPLQARWLYAVDGPRQQLRLRFARAAVDVSLFRDAAGRIAGLRMDGTQITPPPREARVWPLADGGLLVDRYALGQDDLVWPGADGRLALDAAGRIQATRID